MAQKRGGFRDVALSRRMARAPAGGSEPVRTIPALWRFPVKSMRGEELDAADVGEGGIVDDRAYALVDGKRRPGDDAPPCGGRSSAPRRRRDL
jgi:hypothetical protein